MFNIRDCSILKIITMYNIKKENNILIEKR